ncbi:MAG: hypothetical protein NTZ83_05770, partial [Candidatus Pacearchaeota archaeon]|nr:hypothetical protein [Candidatus Pacearchaeota archaeon]
ASAVMSYYKSSFSNVEVKYVESGLSTDYWFGTEIRSAQNGSGSILSRYFGHNTPAIQIDAGTIWKVNSAFSAASNFTNSWYNFSSSITTQNITAKNESRLQNTSVGLGNSYINLHGRTSSTIVVDDVRIRSYTLPEPVYYFGGEESYS